MRFPSLTTCRRLRGSRRLLGFCCPALLTLALGCWDFRDYQGAPVSAVVRGEMQTQEHHELADLSGAAVTPPKSQRSPVMLAQPTTEPLNQDIQPVSARAAAPVIPAPGQPKPEYLPPTLQPKKVETELPGTGTKAGPHLGFSASDSAKMVPINLDTVLRLAETQNGQTAVAREKLNEAFATQEVAAKAWMPDLWVGTSWYRHDGGSSNPDGTLEISNFNAMFAGLEICGRLDVREAVYKKVDAERRTWQQRGEVSKLSAEALVEASTAYVDLLSARAAEGISAKMESKLQDLLQNATALAKVLPIAEIEVARVQAELGVQQQMGRKFREGALAATAKLIYHLGLDPASQLTIMDRQLVAFSLLNAEIPAESLAALALQNGPGIRDMEGLLHLIQDASAKDTMLMQMMPIFDVRVAEGGFGSGQGDHMDWDSRFDLGLQMRWNLTDLLSRREKGRVTQARIGQAQATYHDLQAKLIMGVQEAREAILSGRDQMDIALRQVKYATDAYDRSNTRLKQAPNIQDRSASEVLLAIRGLAAANFAYLMAIRDYDKAQLRLAVLTGTIGGRCE